MWNLIILVPDLCLFISANNTCIVDFRGKHQFQMDAVLFCKKFRFWVHEDYCNVPKFSDRQVWWANSANPDQTAPRSGSTLFAMPSASFGCITLRKGHLVQLLR